MNALTPSHLVIGRRLLTVRESNIQEDNNEDYDRTMEDMNKRVKYINTLLQHYWSRFNSEYLSELRQRHIDSTKKKKSNVGLVIGDVVLIKDDLVLPRNKWKRGVVIELIAGEDKLFRGALLKTYVNGINSYIKRPIQKLIPLEVKQEDKDKDGNEDIETMEDVPDVNRPRRSAALTGELKGSLNEY